MAKPQRYSSGKQSASTVTYSQDHRKWGDDLYYSDTDGIEWVAVKDKWYPVALIEECRVQIDIDRTWQLNRHRDIASALSRGYGYDVRAFWVRWEADTAQPEGQRVQSVHVTALSYDSRDGRERDFTRDEWIAFLRKLRRDVTRSVREF